MQEEIFEVGSEGMSVQNLAEKLACNGGDVMKALFMKGIMVQVNQVGLPSSLLPTNLPVPAPQHLRHVHITESLSLSASATSQPAALSESSY